jgi:hypothetical protein
MSALNAGQGRCQATTRLLIRPVRAAIELGAAADVLSATLRAVHHANRHGSVEDFIAFALPCMQMGRETMLAGHDLELIGSERSLTNFLELDGVATLMRRGMIEPPEIGEVFFQPGMTGAAYIRDRSSEKHTPGWIRRSTARAERRGKHIGKTVKPRQHDHKMLTLNQGDAILHVREVIGTFSDVPLMVSTYGLSGASSPAILPVLPDAARGAEDAA